jgi:hypothetical protein
VQIDLQPGPVQPKPAIRLASRWLASSTLALISGYGLAVAVAAAYLLTSSQVYGVGFPLDDAWIHQTYARNLALLGEWAFYPGQPSAGSTAPLWSMLLALGYLLNLPYFLWTFFLGSVCLFGLAFVGEAMLRRLLPEPAPVVPWAGIFLLGEWHFAWAAVSGMETLLTAGVFLLVLWRASAAHGRTWGVVGLLIGLSVWLRPDGITLLGPAAFVLFFTARGWRERLQGLGWLVGGAALFFGPYLLFNLLVQGAVWPNTFYAKQAEYAELRENIPLLARLLSQLSLPLIGSGLFLLPGFIAFVWQSVKHRRWFALAAIIWFIGYALVYALRLPVVYQYGRYFMPAMPVYFICGIAGTLALAHWLRPRRWAWFFARVWIFSLVGIWAGFFVLGASRYAKDVAIIETEMVAAARWVAVNTPEDSLIAAHDIGALGFFAQRQLVDLAGLVSPEVIPFIRDEGRIIAWLNERQVDYLVVFEGWYAHLPAEKEQAYSTYGLFSPQSGGSNIVIYRWVR